MKSIHIDTLGDFGGMVPRDRDGVVHLTSDGWLASSEAPEGWYGPALVEWAEVSADEARERLTSAQALQRAAERNELIDVPDAGPPCPECGWRLGAHRSTCETGGQV